MKWLFVDMYSEHVDMIDTGREVQGAEWPLYDLTSALAILTYKSNTGLSVAVYDKYVKCKRFWSSVKRWHPADVRSA